ncbi:MAG: DEAD/DEAH box helicase [Caldilineaceae bacterium]|nr:DEAD/DEAH box helicase [Caldilineaceae bacterium]
MDVFDLRNHIIRDYSDYIQSFIHIRDLRIREHVDAELRNGLLWPEPLLQLNPSFEPGGYVDVLVTNGLLHQACRHIFRIKAADGTSKPLRLHQHQADAVDAAASGDNYVLTTGTGSGKSLAYIIPIVDFVLRQGSGQGIRAIVVYPMNALANSQQKELEKFLIEGSPAGRPPVTFRRYTGQEKEEERQEILANPPDILLTNYVMLELLLTRPRDHQIVAAFAGRLQFLVLDELHTYRGRQGADVALLVRRVREISNNPQLQCVGTSATLAGSGSFSEQQQQVADVATRLFGAPVKPERIIGETLRRVTDELDFTDPQVRQALRQRVAAGADELPQDFAGFCRDPLAAWIESTFGLSLEPESGRLKRAQPISISGPAGAAAALAALVDQPPDKCQQAIEQTLMAGYNVLHPDTDFPLFAFRLHQFVSRGDTVYTSLEPPNRRYITTHGQQFVPGDRNRILLPMAFCRECGQEYYTVLRLEDPQNSAVTYLPRDLTDQTGEDNQERGFLYASTANPWPDDLAQAIEQGRLPEDWLENTANGVQVKRASRTRLPLAVRVDPLGQETAGGAPYHYVRSPFAFCLNCGVAYSSRQRSDFGKLASLSSEGRSTATTVLSLATLHGLRQDTTLRSEARKLLSFTDNRQDASLQAGHFNDFVEVGMLRAALHHAVQAAGPAGISHEVLPLRVFEALKLPVDLYAVDPTVKFQARAETDRALREVLAYRLYQDLRRGWRVTAPNLEQCGLLQIEYASLTELCDDPNEWSATHPALADAPPEVRRQIAKTLLDYLRRELAVRVDYLDPVYQERLRQMSSQRLREPWAIDETEQLAFSRIAYPRRRVGEDTRENLYISGRSYFGLYLRRPNVFPHYRQKLSVEESEQITVDLFSVLRVAGLVEVVDEAKDNAEQPGYQVPASSLIWQAADGSQPLHDLIRVPRQSSAGPRINPYFLDFYRQSPHRLHALRAREHTAQVPGDQRQRREDEFRAASLPLLFCSPTMELGVDIAQLNAVNLRNVPPTPANYAQRSGRAGRSGQPALVLSYCTTGSPHDQYFFKRPQRMVAGSVTPPRLDLTNEDLIRAHVHAVWLAETGQSLGRSLKDVLDLEGDEPSLTLQESLRHLLGSSAARERARRRMAHIFATIDQDVQQAGWYQQGWLDRVLDQAVESFDRACDRWRDLYRAAQMELLTAGDELVQSDFYRYRYFASEGFLPGYSFPRLPLSAYIAGRRQSKNERDEYLSRPRFLAISEFGPRSIIYHEGSRYIVNRVILPVDAQGDRGLITRQAKICPHCGHLHPIVEGDYNPDRCEQCDQLLTHPLASLMRMQNVSTRRRDRINSDEEERMRMGYELQTSVRFERGHHAGTRTATVTGSDGEPLLRLTYGHAATIWRINLGWRRRRNQADYGFILDAERGYWAANKEAVEDDPEDAMSTSKQKIVPFVEDRRNCLLIEPVIPLSLEQMASLQPALKNAIQVLYQLEDNELAAEPLPDSHQRRFILIYEAAEGGAGVLRQLLDQPGAIAGVAREALRLCHYDPDTGDDLRHAPNSREACEAACYDCLMSYTNQLDHRLLDRTQILALLQSLAHATVSASPVAASRADHLERLKALCDSGLERTWLDFLESHNFRLPDSAQQLIESCSTRPDFLYTEQAVAVYIDGPHHTFSNIAAEDRRITTCLEDAGYMVIRFGDPATWPEVAQRHAWLFGERER